MKFIFYQNILSIHQSAFIRSLAEKQEVILVVEEELDSKRKEQGWTIPDFGKAVVLKVSGDKTAIASLLSENDVFHLVSGLNNHFLEKVSEAKLHCQGVQIGVLSEPYRKGGLRGALRYWKYKYRYIKYRKYIDLLLLTGKQAKEQFRNLGFDDHKIYSWAYFTETPQYEEQYECANKPSILFAGSIDERKNILETVNILKKMTDLFINFKIVGNGPLVDELKTAIADCPSMEYVGTKNNGEVARLIYKSDLLILPSKFDGWGAVVNEALMCGVPAITSDRCGSSELITQERGRIFSLEAHNMEKTLREYLTSLPYNAKQRERIKKWSIQTISGNAAAHYFTQIINACMTGEKKPIAPWLNNSLH